MEGFAKMLGFLFCVFLLMFRTRGDNGDSGFYEGRYTWFENIEEFEAEKDQCEFALENATHHILRLCEKAAIGNLKIHFLGVSDSHVFDDKADQDDVALLKSSRPVRVDFAVAFDYCMNNLDLNKMSQVHAFIWCLRVALWQYNYYNKSDDNLETNAYNEVDNLEILQVSDSPSRERRSSRFLRRRIAPRNMKRPRSGFRERQEYRTLNVSQRKKFHDALKKLYEDGTIQCFSRIHRSAITKGGNMKDVAYLMWHRAFVALFEEALRQVDDTVSMPYWDSSIDYNMNTPAHSVIWDDTHLGTNKGVIDNGPFKGWNAGNEPLRRDAARGIGSLLSQVKIDGMMKFCRFGDFSPRLTLASFGVHRWVGGTMARSYSASDPLFYMHYAFVDHIWVKFQIHQMKDCKINPEFDYPPTNNKKHSPKAKMSGMKFLRNKDGIASYWTKNWYNYKDRPSCVTKCDNSPDMFCDLNTNLCTGKISSNVLQVGK